jgi:alanyl-tRNA synthetase
MSLSSKEILQKYIAFYKARGHSEIANVSLIPENDSTLLFVNSGMFPLVPYLMGEPHPMGTRLVNVQRSIRLEDIEEVGDNRHTTAFHMMGNWSLSDYFKEEQLTWIYTFLFDELGLDPERIYSTVFAGDREIPSDEVSAKILAELFTKKGVEPKKNERIFYSKSNWWKRGDAVGELGGPDSEIFYYVPRDASKGRGQNLEQNENDFLEIGNSVFLQYVKTSDGWKQMSMQNVDFGGGLERMALAVQGKEDIYETDNFWPIVEKLQDLTGKNYKDSLEITHHMRIIADHIRSSVFLAMDGVLPSNKDQGYVLRRLLRRIVRSAKNLGIEKNMSVDLIRIVVEMFTWLYPQLEESRPKIEALFIEEESKFRKTVNKASKEVDRFFEKGTQKISMEILAKQAFIFFQSLGYPEEDFLEDIREHGIKIDSVEFLSLFRKMVEEHKAQSREGAEKKFKGGLADEGEITVKYHTATHLLQASLQRVLGDSVVQEGSNLTQERLRFDFRFDRLLTEEELRQVEELVNSKIAEALPVKFEIMDKEAALQTKAMHLFADEYGEKVKVYYIGDSLETAFSKEFCGGPHVGNTSELARLELYKQQKIGQKIVRVYGSFAKLP